MDKRRQQYGSIRGHGPGTITLTTTITAGTVQFTQNGYTIDGPTRTLNVSTFDVANGRSATINAQTAGTSVNKSGGGTLILGNSFNSYSNGITVNAGTLVAGTAGALASSGTMNLNGGTLSTGTGVSTNAGPLKVSSLSDITLGNSAHILQFSFLDTSSGFAGLNINNWAGAPGGSGTQGKIFFADPSNFNPSLLNTITFNLAGGGSITGGQILPSNELVPVPEPVTVLGIAAAGLALTRLRRGRRSGLAVC